MTGAHVEGRLEGVRGQDGHHLHGGVQPGVGLAQRHGVHRAPLRQGRGWAPAVGRGEGDCSPWESQRTSGVGLAGVGVARGVDGIFSRGHT